MSLPPHTGLLRDENLALRRILGYCLETTTSSAISITPLSINLPGSLIKDLLLVSVDVDTIEGYEEISPDQNYHIGISTLDTRHLQDFITHPPPPPPPSLNNHYEGVIQSRQFIVGTRRYTKRAEKRFLFGDSERILITELKTKFESITQGRDYILVFQGSNEDNKVLQQLGIGGDACFILDTVKAAQFPLQLYYRYSLEKLLQSLNISYANLHAAGNDAYFTLRALLMIAVKDAEHLGCDSPQLLFRTLSAIAHAPRSLSKKEMPSPPPKPAKLGIFAKRRLRAERKKLLLRREDEEAVSVRDGEVSFCDVAMAEPL